MDVDTQSEIVHMRDMEKTQKIARVRWTLEKAIEACKRRGYLPIEGTEQSTFWIEQSDVPPRRRRIMLKKRRTIRLESVLQRPEKSKIVCVSDPHIRVDKRTLTLQRMRMLGVGCQWMEASAYQAAKLLLDPTKTLQWVPILGGLSADVMVKYSHQPFACGIQVKCRQFCEMDLSFRVSKVDAKYGGRYFRCMLLVIIIEPIEEKALSILNSFNQVPTAKIREMLIFNDVEDIPSDPLKIPFQRIGDDGFEPHHYIVHLHGPDRLEEVRRTFINGVHSHMEQRFTKEDFFFGLNSGKSPNTSVTKKLRQEILNIKALARIFGLQSIEAPIRSGECVDVVLLGKWRLSIKSVSCYNKNTSFAFLKGKENFINHCNGILAFYRGGHIGLDRTHVSVIDKAVGESRQWVRWSADRNAHILRNRISLKHPDAAASIVNALKMLPSNARSYEEIETSTR